MSPDDDVPPYEHGSQTTPEHPTPPASEGRSVAQKVVIAIAILVILAGLLWVALPLVG